MNGGSRISGGKEMKRLALALLLFMLATFIVSVSLENVHPWLAWIRAFAEAGSIGAIADWFAVTALFRHPIGLPVPHTAIIPRNKDEIGRALGIFVQENFLTPHNLTRKLAGLDAVGTTARWLQSPRNSQRCARAACEFVPGLLARLDDKDVSRFLDRIIVPWLARLDISTFAGRFLEIMTHDGRHQALLDHGLRTLDTWLSENRALIREKFSEASRYTPGIFDYYVVNRFVDGIVALLHEVALNPRHEIRARFDAATQAFIDDLKASPEYAARGRGLVRDLAGHLRSQSYYEVVWKDLQALLLEDIARPSSLVITALAELLQAIGHGIATDAPLRGRLEAWLIDGIEPLLIRHRQEISGLISDVIATWDAKEVADKLEAEIGRDLQYIRINGTLVGGLAGVLLHGLGMSFGR